MSDARIEAVKHAAASNGAVPLHAADVSYAIQSLEADLAHKQKCLEAAAADAEVFEAANERLKDDLEKAREALRPFARLQLPAKSVGNAGPYPILFSDVERAAQTLSALEGK